MRALGIITGLAACALLSQSAHGQYGATDGDWAHYGADPGSTKYSNLDQINADNFGDLEVAWRWETADTALKGKTQFTPYHFRPTPLEINGVAYLSTGLSQVAAVDIATGETLWVYDPKSYTRGMVTHFYFHHRGVAYWSDGDEERIFIATGGRQLVSVDAKTGKPDPKFNNGKWVDLLKDLGREVNPRSIGNNKPPVIVGDTVIVGSIITDFGMMKEAPPGHIRAYDARTGKLKWRFNTIPQKGEYGNETWLNDSWVYSGNTNAWSLLTADHELGYVYLPIGTPSSDYYGGHRHGDNLFAETLLCLNAETGERVWHFQGVHHGIWDYDFPCAPNLIDLTVDGKEIKAVAQASKQGFLYVFDRVTGEPIWPIEEKPVNDQSEVPGEKLSPTQPFPTKPPAFERQGITEDDLIDFTPELREEAIKIASDYVMGPLFSPHIVQGANGKKAAMQVPSVEGGANWPGASTDPETGYLFVQSQAGISAMSNVKPDPARSDLDYVGANTSSVWREGPQGLPLIKPPYRTITAYDLNKGDIAWQIPLGPGPKDHPAIKDLELGDLGSPFPNGIIAEGGILVTKTLLITALVDTDHGSNLTGKGSYLQAYDKKTGELVSQVQIDRHLHGSPMTCEHEGRQYIIVSGGGANEPSELIAFALPE